MKSKYIYFIIFIICILLACISFIPLIISLIYPTFDYGSSSVGKLDRYINQHIYFDIIIYLSFDILAITVCLYLFYEKRWSVKSIIIVALIMFVILFVTIYPLLAIMNIVLLTKCDNPPIFDESLKYNIFPQAWTIEYYYHDIKTEYIEYENKNNQKIQCTYNLTPGFRIGAKDDNKCWRMIILKKAGKFTDEAMHNFPMTCNICDHPSIHNAFFSILDSYVNIPSHIGYYKGYIRYHLGVIIPKMNNKRPFINVGGKYYYWENGEGVLFDDMYYHYVENPTNKRRVVLYIDIIRPLNGILGGINHFFIKLIEMNPFVMYYTSKQHQQKKLQ